MNYLYTLVIKTISQLRFVLGCHCHGHNQSGKSLSSSCNLLLRCEFSRGFWKKFLISSLELVCYSMFLTYTLQDRLWSILPDVMCSYCTSSIGLTEQLMLCDV